MLVIMVLIYMGRKNALFKNDLAILNIIAANKWKRPIYFTMPYNKLGFDNYLRRDGMAYRLVPVENPSGLPRMQVNSVSHYSINRSR